MQNVTLEEIMRLHDNPFDTFDFAQQHEIPLDGCETQKESLERICLHKQKLSGSYTHVLDEQKCESIRTSIQHKYRALYDIVDSIQNGLAESLPLLAEIFKSCENSDDLIRDFDDHMTSLKNRENNIVFAGQTNAGKSTLLNLLLRMEILPKSVLSCTSSICKLRYGQRFKVKVTQGGKTTEVEFKNRKEAAAYLEQLVAVEDIYARERGETVREVDIYLPATILKTGITIVDTPGFGENESMDNLLKDFIGRGGVSAFVYVIKTDSGGGVQEDRLVKFLKTFLEKNVNNNGEPSFNPRAALFVCNRWDLINDDEKEGVRDNVLDKLSDIWPDLEDNQLRFISTTKAQSSLDVDQEYIIEDLHNLLTSLSGLFGLAQHDTIKRSYRWLKEFMKDSTMYLTTILSQIAASEKEHETSYAHARNKLETLDSRANEMIIELKEELEMKTITMMEKFKTMLNSRDVWERLTIWTKSELPETSGIPGAWQSQKTEIDAIIVNKIFKLFDNMNECVTFACDLRSSMLSKVKRKLGLLDSDMKEITMDLNGGDSLRSSTSSEESAFSQQQEHALLLNEMTMKTTGFAKRIREYNIRSKEIKSFDPRAFACRVIAPFVDQVVKLKEFRKESMVVDNPLFIMNKRAKKVIDALVGDDALLRMLVTRYTSSIVHQIDSIRLNIPIFIRENKALMRDAIDYRNEAKTDRGELKRAMELLEPYKELVRGFGCLHVNDIAYEDVLFQLGDSANRTSKIIVDPTGNTDHGSKRDIYSGLWTTIQKADLTVDKTSLPVMIKLYINQLPEQQLFKEVAKLRCLNSPSIGTFLGMTRTEDQSAFVFDTHLVPVRRYLRRASTMVREEVPPLLLQVLEGLEAIHRDGLVHMELSSETVMVNFNGDVKLCNMCLPRKCLLPPQMDTMQTSEFVCLSPMVLRGNTYTSDADLYGFGILAYEILLKKQPYAQQREWPLSRFVSDVHPSAMLQLSKEPISDLVSEMLRGCLFPAQGLRLPLVRLKNMAKALDDDTTVAGLRSARLPMVRRRSSGPQNVLHEIKQHNITQFRRMTNY